MLCALLLATSPYGTETLEGWTVHVEPALVRDHKAEWGRVKRELTNQLYRIGRVVPDPPLAELRKVPIYVSWSSGAALCMAYHPSAQWLREHKFDPAMAKSIQIGSATNFLSWTYEQPWMVLHELAHAYHDQVLDRGYRNDELQKAHARAKEDKKYESVLHINGKMQKHYALNNPMEYFAEASEAYFGTNDFYPFVKSELKQHDPEMFELLGKLWGLKAK